MGYLVFRILTKDSRKLEEILKDDIVSRQSISTRDARSLGAPGEGTLVLIEGSEKALHRADELLKGMGEKLHGREAEHVHELFRREAEDVASGVGFVFGP